MFGQKSEVCFTVSDVGGLISHPWWEGGGLDAPVHVPPHLKHVNILSCEISAADKLKFQQASDGVCGHVQVGENGPDFRRSWGEWHIGPSRSFKLVPFESLDAVSFAFRHGTHLALSRK